MTINSVPIYGVEPYNPFAVAIAADYGGGADVTQENLLVTLWTCPDDDDLTIPGELIKPGTWSAGGVAASAAYGPAARKQGARSRLSAKIAIVEDDGEAGPPSVIAFLNPPQELKEAFLLNDPASLAYLGLNSGMSFTSQLLWAGAIVNYEGEVVDADFLFSGIGGAGSIPFAKSSGADGVWPEFYGDLTDPAAGVDMLNALRAGEPFFVAAIIQPNEDASVAHIKWPFSGGARG